MGQTQERKGTTQSGRWGWQQRLPSVPSPRRLPRNRPRASPATLPEVPPAPGTTARALRPVLGYSVRLAVSYRELRNTTDSPGSRTPREVLGSGIPPRRAGQRHRPSTVGAAGGTSALGPGRDRAVTGGSCSPPVVGGARGSCAVHRGLFHICNNR